MREAIGAAERLTFTLRYLASGDNQQSLGSSYRIGKTTVSHIIQETSYAIWLALKVKYVSPPNSASDWKNISKDFESIWHLAHCIGAIDGKHIAIRCPGNGGSLYYNYKGWLSIVLLAVCDASYNFTLVDIGQYGSTNDSSVLTNSEMGKAFENGYMSFPKREHLLGCRQTLLVTAQLALWTAFMVQEIFYQESGRESLQLMKVLGLFTAYMLQEAQDIAICYGIERGLESIC
ncbi:putative nuclease HARBI1 [Montipora capricornis]|uniref:putative nuclease HARBI1 n=1 Tax=Montipora capricornis TaxID=246305 RepID=UPI0035F16BD3